MWPPQSRLVYSGIVRTKEAWRQRAYVIITQTTSLLDPTHRDPVSLTWWGEGPPSLVAVVGEGRWLVGLAGGSAIIHHQWVYKHIGKMIKLDSWCGTNGQTDTRTHARSSFFLFPTYIRESLEQRLMDIHDEINIQNVLSCFGVLLLLDKWQKPDIFALLVFIPILMQRAAAAVLNKYPILQLKCWNRRVFFFRDFQPFEWNES